MNITNQQRKLCSHWKLAYAAASDNRTWLELIEIYETEPSRKRVINANVNSTAQLCVLAESNQASRGCHSEDMIYKPITIAIASRPCRNPIKSVLSDSMPDPLGYIRPIKRDSRADFWIPYDLQRSTLSILHWNPDDVVVTIKARWLINCIAWMTALHFSAGYDIFSQFVFLLHF